MVEAGRDAYVRAGRRLQLFSVVWNVAEGVVSVAAGAMAGSVALLGFGLDSFIEVTSGGAALWRLGQDADPARREAAEHRALRLVGACFLALAAYVAVEAVESLWRHQAPERSPVGIAIAAVSLVVMPLLARAKRRVAAGLASGALRADSRQTDFCAWLSAVLLGGLLLNALAGLWWADPAAALVMAPIIAREGIDGLRARSCCDCQ